MTEPLGPVAAPKDSAVAGRIVFSLAGERFALPIDAVEGVASPPPLARVPHAAPALLGAGHLGGRIVPILALARLLGRECGADGYDGSGEVLRLRVAGGSIGLWVDKVERVIGGPGELEAISTSDGVQPIDPAALLADRLDPPGLAAVAQAALGEVAHAVAETLTRTPAPAFIVVEAGGRPVSLPREAVQELIQAVAWTPVPRAPEGFLGVGVIARRGTPLVSLAVLLGLEDRQRARRVCRGRCRWPESAAGGGPHRRSCGSGQPRKMRPSRSMSRPRSRTSCAALFSDFLRKPRGPTR